MAKVTADLGLLRRGQRAGLFADYAVHFGQQLGGGQLSDSPNLHRWLFFSGRFLPVIPDIDKDVATDPEREQVDSIFHGRLADAPQ